MRSLLPLVTALALAGCAHVPPAAAPVRVVVQGPVVPRALLRCEDEPDPLPEAAPVGAVAGYVVDLAEAGQDCRRKLGTVGRIVGGKP